MQCAGDIFAIKKMLISAVDKNFNVVDQERLNEILGLLEIYPMTQAELEQTRIGKFVNEVRKKTADSSLSKRAKELVKKWQRVINLGSVKANSDSPRGKLANAAAINRIIITPSHSNSCSPASDYTASPALLSQLPAKYQNGLKSEQTVCSCTSFDEHIAKCENPSSELIAANGSKHASNHKEDEVCSKSFNSHHDQENPSEKPVSTTTVSQESLDHDLKTEPILLKDQAVTRGPASTTTSEEGILGTLSCGGVFKEWDEVVERGSPSEPLFVLPYTVID